MSEHLPPMSALGEEARAVLADRAAGSARANTPRYLLVGAGGIMAIGSALLLGAGYLRAGASAQLEQARAQQRSIQRAVSDYLALRAADEEDRKKNLYGEDLTKFQKIVDHGVAAGIEGLSASQAFDQRTLGAAFRRVQITVTLGSPVPPDLLARWIADVQEREPGVDLARLELTPARATHEGVPRWTGTVVFSRWERKP